MGAPGGALTVAPAAERVALLADDFIGMRPRMAIKEGDEVRLGQPLFEDRKRPGVIHTAPAGGTVASINRGDRRALRSIVLDVAKEEIYQEFKSYKPQPIENISAESVRALLIESGQWTALRTRPFSRSPAIDSVPRSIFVTAMDSNPLAVDPAITMGDRLENIKTGLIALAKIAPVEFCVAPGSALGAVTNGLTDVRMHSFSGPHPAGTPGLHIHLVNPVNAQRQVWYLHISDVAGIGHLFSTGRLDVSRIVGIGGPSVTETAIVKTRLGAPVGPLVEERMKEGDQRIIIGSLFNGRTNEEEAVAFLGRWHHQISVLPSGREREFMGWARPGPNRFSVLNAFMASWLPGRQYNFTTSTNGSLRTIIPVSSYDQVMPFEIMPTFLLRSIQAGDLETAENLGALELDEEDLALCSFVCPGKIDHCGALRDLLTRLEKEG